MRNADRAGEKTKPRATKAWSRGANNKFELKAVYFGCSFRAAELMQ
jgi:hypothetical protein